MKFGSRNAWLPVLVAAMSLSQMQCLFIPDDQERGDRVANVRPSVRITGGVFNSDSAGVDYRVDFSWHGWDDDGVVTSFEWAVDDTTLETAWRTTTLFTDQFRFRATRKPDSETDRFYDWHRFFVRAVDNEFARSSVDSRFFNARTIAPETRITFPDPELSGQLVRRPRSFNVMWEGEDLDSTKPERTPDFYEYKLVQIEFNDNPVEALRERQNIFLDTLQVGDRNRWIRIPSSKTSIRLTELPVFEVFVFGVRAVDEAGAVEPSLDQGTNYFVFEVTDQECQPIVEVTESKIGTFVFPTEGPRWSVEVPSNIPLRFQWTGDAEYCGSRSGNVNYALDVPDPGDENLRSPDGIGGWIGWGGWTEVQTPFSFPDRDDGKVHNFYIKMRDESNTPNSEQFCWIQITVVAFPFNSSILLVDDASPPPSFVGAPGSEADRVHDAFVDRVLACAWDFLEPGEEIGKWAVYNDRERAFQSKEIPLSLVAQYKTILWNSYFFGRQNTGLNANEDDRKILTNYVGAGGRLYLFGSKPVCGLADDNFTDSAGDGICADVQGAENTAWDDKHFIWKFLHLRNCVIGASSGRSHIDGWVGSDAVHPLYPDLQVNTAVWDPYEITNQGRIRGGTTAFQVFRAAGGIPNPPIRGMDTIYVADALEYDDLTSQLDGQPIALRFQSTPEDSALNLDHGRVFLQMFPFLFIDELPAQEAACKAISWIMTGRDE